MTAPQNPQQLTSKTQGVTSKMPKRYSDMGTIPGTNQVNSTKFVNLHSGGQAINSNGVSADRSAVKEIGQQPTFHPTLTNEYMLSQDSLILNEVNSRPSR